MHGGIGNLDRLTYGEIGQEEFNMTEQGLTVYYRDGGSAEYEWRVGEGLQEPFRFNDTQSIKEVLNSANYLYFTFKDIEFSKEYTWDLTFQIEVIPKQLRPSPIPPSSST
mgnify:CR=1 FL=1